MLININFNNIFYFYLLNNKYLFKIIYFLFTYINIPYEKEIKYINNL